MNDSNRIEIGEGGWGHHVSLIHGEDWTIGRVYGHMLPLPKEGRAVSLRMKSGAIHTGTLVDFEYCSNPADMFFARIRWDDWLMRCALRWPRIFTRLYRWARR